MAPLCKIYEQAPSSREPLMVPPLLWLGFRDFGLLVGPAECGVVGIHTMYVYGFLKILT